MTPDDYRHWSAARVLAAETRSIENPAIPISDTNGILQMFGVLERNGALPLVSIEAALQVPAVWSIVSFLSRTLAALPLQTFAAGENGEKIDDGPAQLLSIAPNDEESTFDWRRWHWQQVFTGGRGCSWIDRSGDGRPGEIYPMDPAQTEIVRYRGRKLFKFDGREYPTRDVIDTPFMLKPDRLGSYSPIAKCNKAISLAIAMGDFAGSFFAGGGVPPLALEGPLPSGADALKRAQSDIKRAIDMAKAANTPFFGMPPGHSLKPIGVEPDKGQMTEARLFQVQEISRIWQMPPAFVQDLSKGTFSNTEQQDIQLAKHLILHWATCFEQEVSLKFHGRRNPKQRVKHNLDGLQRGAFKDRIEALARAIQSGIYKPDEARAKENLPPAEGGDQLFIQGATVPITMAGKVKVGTPANDVDASKNEETADAGTED